MGNMSNPSINRWGSTMFWLNSWYSTSTYSYDQHFARLALKFFNLFAQFGLERTFPPFWSMYYKLKQQNISYSRQFFSKYHIRSSFTNKFFNVNELYNARKKWNNGYFSRTWLLKFESWFLLSSSIYITRKPNMQARRQTFSSFVPIAQFASSKSRLLAQKQINFVRSLYFF